VGPLEVIGSLGLGLGLGVVTGIPIGLVNVAVIEGAARHGRGHGIGIAAGGATADTVHAFLGFAGVGAVITRHPVVPPILWAVAGVAVALYGVALLRRRGEPESIAPEGGAVRVSRRRGFVAGLAITLPNPSALAAWVVVGALLGPTGYAASAAVAAGVGVGSFGWFSALAFAGARGHRRGGAPAWLSALVALALIGFGLFALVRAALGTVALAS
jgi:threonine/homoserine/homoserine lactone efflux protein